MKQSDESRLSWLHKHYMVEKDFEIEHAVDENYHEVEPHYHEFYEMLFFVSGNVDYFVADERFHLRKGDLLIIPPGTFHGPIFLNFEVSYERFVLWISVRTIDRLIMQDPDLGYFRGRKPMYLYHSRSEMWTGLNGSFLTLFNSYLHQNPCYKSEGLSVIMQILVQYNRAIAARSRSVQEGSRETLLSGVLQYVRNNLTGDLSLDAVAAAFYTSKSHISHLFKQEMRISYYQYVIQLRLLEGKNLILAEVPIHKVWESCGFSDHTAFYRAFRKWYGISPSQFIKVHFEQLEKSEQ
ncbi:AraC family transcriptional regulator [Clostridiaceae bacterium]|nr:AraC family transcriptional regulator [Clostridiaceae bacterium]